MSNLPFWSLASPSTTHPQPEIKLPLCCLRNEIKSDCLEGIEDLIQAPINWDSVVRLARWHAISSLIYWHLKNIQSRLIPKNTLQELQNDFQSNARKQLVFIGELLEILDLCQKYKIPAKVIKGPQLATLVYKHPQCRQFSDLDILIPRNFVLELRKILLEEGYICNLNLNPEEEKMFIDNNYKTAFLHKHKKIK